MATKLSLSSRKNIKENDPKLAAHLEKIAVRQSVYTPSPSGFLLPLTLFSFALFSPQAATGITFEIDVDWLEFVEPIEIKGYKDRVGDVVVDWYVYFLLPKFTHCVVERPSPETCTPLFAHPTLALLARIMPSCFWAMSRASLEARSASWQFPF